jgi:phenylpropionate dioxygenase-like ring-hydroxylating dioxygenase large terminal subunit
LLTPRHPLEYARVEEEGLRCCYHGWLYDTQGHCIEMPCETAEICKKMDVWHPAYPAKEYGGLVFLYMGPPDTKPLLLPMAALLRQGANQGEQ